jgi:hypothetical protein
MKWEEHRACMGSMRNACRCQPETLKERVHLADLSMDGKIILLHVHPLLDNEW